MFWYLYRHTPLRDQISPAWWKSHRRLKNKWYANLRYLFFIYIGVSHVCDVCMEGAFKSEYSSYNDVSCSGCIQLLSFLVQGWTSARRNRPDRYRMDIRALCICNYRIRSKLVGPVPDRNPRTIHFISYYPVKIGWTGADIYQRGFLFKNEVRLKLAGPEPDIYLRALQFQ